MTLKIEASEKNGERIAKRMARAGLCSRREAESWIAEGRVKVNGKKIDSPALNVTELDEIRVDGKLLAGKEQTRLWLYHKPVGLMTTHKDPEGRPTVFQSLPKTMPRVISVGRLDVNSEGLLLLTNDGELARKLELPATGWIRRYRVRVHGKITADMLSEIKKGVVIAGVHYQGAEVVLEDSKSPEPDKDNKNPRPRAASTRLSDKNQWLQISIREGKNREVRRIFEHFDCKVSRLIRLSYGPFLLGKLARGEVKEVTQKVLRAFVGE